MLRAWATVGRITYREKTKIDPIDLKSLLAVGNVLFCRNSPSGPKKNIWPSRKAWQTNSHQITISDRPLSRTIAQRKTKIRNNDLGFLLAGGNSFSEQKLQSDWKKSIWASQKAWQTNSHLLCLFWSQSLLNKCTKWCELDSSPGSNRTP